jgi:hypothetical protein
MDGDDCITVSLGDTVKNEADEEFLGVLQPPWSWLARGVVHALQGM